VAQQQQQLEAAVAQMQLATGKLSGLLLVASDSMLQGLGKTFKYVECACCMVTI
jgi:hypothetical protein